MKFVAKELKRCAFSADPCLRSPPPRLPPSPCFRPAARNDQSASASSEGRVISETHRQDVTPGGTKVQTHTQVRETPSGQRVRETEMKTREDVTAQPNTGNR